MLLLRSSALLIVIELIVTAAAYSKQTVVDKRVPRITAGEYSLQSLLITLALATGVPIGIEIASGDSGKPRFYKERPAGVSLGKVLDDLFPGNNQYEWKQNGGVINVFPKRDRSNVFSVNINSFEVKNAVSTEILQQLLKHPAVADYLSRRGITPATWVTGSVPMNRNSFSFRKLSFRAALDAIVLATGRSGWTAFSQRQNSKEYLWFQLW